jgi:hypothetical protein
MLKTTAKSRHSTQAEIIIGPRVKVDHKPGSNPFRSGI